jgi:chorismate dehydratase
MSLRIGKIEYANCVPLFRALCSALGDDCHHFVTGVPAILNGMLAHGEIDLSPSSSIVYGADPERYWLVPDLSISATGPVKSVLLFSRLPLENLNGRLIGLTNESDTSVALLKIVLARFFGFDNEFERTDLKLPDALSRFSALLLIGDAALRESLEGHDCYIYDLGEIWYRFTGLPFVFALWIINRAAIVGRENEVRELVRSLQEAKCIARQKLAGYVEGSGLEWFGAEELIAYWKTISYDLGAEEIKGVKAFYNHAAELGIIAAAPDLNFFPG